MMKKLQVLGTGCAKCTKLAENVETAARELGLDYELEKVTDIVKITEFGLMTPPALVVDGQVKLSGKLLSPEELKPLLT